MVSLRFAHKSLHNSSGGGLRRLGGFVMIGLIAIGLIGRLAMSFGSM